MVRRGFLDAGGLGTIRTLRVTGQRRTVVDMHRDASSILRRATRASLASAAVIVLFRLLLDVWTAIEAAAVGAIASLVGSSDVSRAGSQLLVRGEAGTFVLNVVAWCSSLGPVLAVAAAAVVVPGDRRRRIRWALFAVMVLVVGNLVRISAVVVVGADIEAARLEPFHDGPATAFAVVLVLSATAMVAWSTLPVGQRRRRQHALP